MQGEEAPEGQEQFGGDCSADMAWAGVRALPCMAWHP